MLLTPEALKTTTEALGLSCEDAEALAAAAAPLWRELDRLAWTDSFGGAEFQRVFPVALATIRDHANIHPDGEQLPGWAERLRSAQLQSV